MANKLISKTETFYTQYLYDGKWHFAKDGDHRIEAASLHQANDERDTVAVNTQCKTRILLVTTVEKVVGAPNKASSRRRSTRRNFRNVEHESVERLLSGF